MRSRSSVEARIRPYSDEEGVVARLDLPALLQGETPEIPTWYVRWNGSSYDLVDNIDTPTVYMTWNESNGNNNGNYEDKGVSYNPATGNYILGDPASGEVFNPNLFHATIGCAIGTTNNQNVDATATLPPGYYPYGMSLSNGDDIELDPDLGDRGTRADKLFIFGGGLHNITAGLYMTGGRLTGEGVTCYVTKNFVNDESGVIDIDGGSLNVKSPGDFENEQNHSFNLDLVQGINGIAIWMDPDMDPLATAHLNGNGHTHISGTIYFPDPIHTTLQGTLTDTGNQLLCGSVEVTGTAMIHVRYDGRNAGNGTVHICIVK